LSPLALSLRFLQTQSDEQLAALARAGHERAFEALVRRYRRPLLAYCRRIGSPQTNPEDTLQQGLLQAWSAIRTGVEVREPRAWLYRIVHNVSISNHRRPVLVPLEMRDTAGANGADFEAEQRMAARDALAGLAALPDLQREVMVGTAVDGMSHDELASALGLSSGAVRGLIYRARATLRAAAAAITPGPLISWALRSGSGPGSGLYEALAGGGTAGIGGILVKGGAIAATAGAIATATGISTSHKAVQHPATPAVAAVRPHVVTQPASGASHRVLVVDPTSSHIGSGRGSASQNPTSASSGRGTSDGDGFAATSGKRDSSKHRDGGDGNGSSGSGGRGSGHDGSSTGSGSGTGSSHDGSGSGSGSGGSGSGTGSTTVTGGTGSDDHSGKDGGGSDGASSGSSGSGSGDSLSGGGSTLTTTIPSGSGTSGSSGGSGSGSGSSGSGSGSSGSGSGGGTTTTTTATTSDDGSSDSGHHGGK
jgi:RNA polymerase sigma factor (sigma-70 family)